MKNSFKSGEEFGRNIREIRQNKGLTLEEIGVKAELSQSYLSDVERGKIRSPGIDVMKRIAEALDISIDRIANVNIEDNHEISEETDKSEEFELHSLNLGINPDIFRKALEYPGVRLTVKVFSDSSISEEVKENFDRIIGSAYQLIKEE